MFKQGLRKTVFGRSAQHYKAIPLVNLLPNEKRQPLRLFGAEGADVFIRLGLVAAIIAAGVLAVVVRGQTAQYEDLEGKANRRMGTAITTIDTAEALQSEISSLTELGNVGEQDYEFLVGDPEALVHALQSVFALQVPGVVIVDIETSDASAVAARLHAESNAAAFEWRRLIGSAPGVGRVLTFDPITSETGLIYDVTLVAGGR